MTEIGEIVNIAESDRCYGVGPLTLRVVRIGGDLARHPGLEWVRVEGVELLPDGSDGDECQVLVRAAALR